VASAATRAFGAARDLMIVALLIAGIVFLLAGVLGIFLGVPVKEFSFGNTLILAGVVCGCTGMLTLGLAAVIRELKEIAGRLESGAVAAPSTYSGPGAEPRSPPPENPGFGSNRDQVSPTPDSAAPPPWHEESAARERTRSEPPMPAPAAEAARQRRNLMFSSSRKEGSGRAETRVTDLSAIDPRPAAAALPSSAKPADSSPPAFEGGRPQSERVRGGEPQLPRRAGRSPSAFTEPAPGTSGTDRSVSAAREEDKPAVTVLKSGIVDGMAYSLYSDGSIEAQMPEGLMRFGSIDELRAHLDQRS
jgi:hypothetical protein